MQCGDGAVKTGDLFNPRRSERHGEHMLIRLINQPVTEGTVKFRLPRAHLFDTMYACSVQTAQHFPKTGMGSTH